MEQFFHEFVKGKLVAETMLKDRKIEIRFAFFENKVVSKSRNLSFHCLIVFSSLMATKILLNRTAFQVIPRFLRLLRCLQQVQL
jgi:hypothetical protein